MFRKILMMAALALGLMACEVDRVGFGPPLEEGRPDVLVPDDPEIRLVEASPHTGFGNAERLVVEDPEEWASVWATWTGTITPTPPAPEVDFEEERVVVATMGTRPTGGYRIGVSGVERRPGETVVRLFTVAPGSGCAVTLALTAPAVAVAIPASSVAVRFATTHYVEECGGG
ncbi:MAG TPA: protease complex subunit PrcB family protein [Longimicrobiales bacterium]|nr:protease complex subunit PrcB family protein [Longimicrobiales bacterium]